MREILRTKGMEREDAVILCNGKIYTGYDHNEIIAKHRLFSDTIYTLDLMTDGSSNYLIAHDSDAIRELDKLQDSSDISNFNIGVYINLRKGEFVILADFEELSNVDKVLNATSVFCESCAREVRYDRESFSHEVLGIVDDGK